MVTRREFVKQTAGAATVLSGFSPNEKIVLGIMGLNGRGSDLAGGFTAIPGVEIAYICDVDDRAIAKGIGVTGKRQEKAPQGVKDFRRILDDKAVDALVV